MIPLALLGVNRYSSLRRGRHGIFPHLLNGSNEQSPRFGVKQPEKTYRLVKRRLLNVSAWVFKTFFVIKLIIDSEPTFNGHPFSLIKEHIIRRTFVDKHLNRTRIFHITNHTAHGNLFDIFNHSLYKLFLKKSTLFSHPN